MRFAPYQRRFLAAVDDPRYRTVAASWPRGAGKTTAAGYIVARALTPGDSLYVAGGEVVLFAGSIEQCRLTYRQALTFLGPRIGEYRLVDSATRVAITHKASRTRLKAVGSNPENFAWDWSGVPLAILDEPAALHTARRDGAMGRGEDRSWARSARRSGRSSRARSRPRIRARWWPDPCRARHHGWLDVGRDVLQGRADQVVALARDPSRQPARTARIPSLPKCSARNGTRRSRTLGWRARSSRSGSTSRAATKARYC